MSKILETIGISKTYHTSLVPAEALKDCTVSFEEGEFAAIVGMSGSGKTTLLRLLGTLDVPDTGDILLRGKSVLKLTDDELSALRRREIGIIYQDYSLFPEYTAYENIVMPFHLDGRKEDRAEIRDLMDVLGISHCRNHFPNEMSGGEQQRTAIARALSAHPAVILADEPTGNLDAKNSAEVVQLMKKASQLYRQTIIMVTHDRTAAEYADRLITIRDGVVST